jgi:hypothetical protein
LSLPAYAKANAIMALESVLDELEERTRSAVRDSGRYFVSVFGTPGDAVWGWRLEGHHVVLNFTLARGEIISPTPIFFGANPAEVRHGHASVTRPCAEEEDAARALLLSLTGEQRRSAILHETAPPDIVLSNAPRVPETCQPGEVESLVARLFDGVSDDLRSAVAFAISQPRGIAPSALDGAQRKLLSELIDVYVDRLPESLAGRERAKVDAAQVYFAWAGEDTPRRPHYYRLQGPDFVVEYDNTQDDSNHVHAVWRNPANDFGYDALRSHIHHAH